MRLWPGAPALRRPPCGAPRAKRRPRCEPGLPATMVAPATAPSGRLQRAPTARAARLSPRRAPAPPRAAATSAGEPPRGGEGAELPGSAFVKKVLAVGAASVVSLGAVETVRARSGAAPAAAAAALRQACALLPASPRPLPPTACPPPRCRRWGRVWRPWPPRR